MWILIDITICLLISVYAFMRQAKFGELPNGERLKEIQSNTNYQDGSFKNLSLTPDLTEGTTYMQIVKEMIFKSHPDKMPKHQLPSVKTDIKNLSSDEDVLIWFGHSSYFIQLDGKKFLVDPVFSGSVSPVSWIGKSFNGTDIYSSDDMPEIDYLFITHDHWDHLNYETLTQLKHNIKTIVCSLGVAAHLIHWGFDANRIIEKAWNQTFELEKGFIVSTHPARHFSGRGLKRNQSLWTSYMLKTPSMKIYLGGDSGYDSHFKEIGQQHSDIDLAILECGQYNRKWRYIHMQPDEVSLAARDLGTKKLLPVHWGKFALANHAWNEPIKILSESSLASGFSLLNPMIGEKVLLKEDHQLFTSWWL